MIIEKKKWLAKIILGFIFGGLSVWGIHIIDKQVYWTYSIILGNYYRLLILFIFGFVIGMVDGIIEKSLIRIFVVAFMTGIGGSIIWYFVWGGARGMVGWLLGSFIYTLLGGSIAFWNGIGVNLFRLYKAEISKEEFYFNIGRRTIVCTILALILAAINGIPFIVLSEDMLYPVREILGGAFIGLITYVLDMYYRPLNFKKEK